MKLTFLGTGTSQGVPVIGCDCDVCTSLDPRDSRLRSSVLIEVDGVNIVIDTGPDFRQQMLRERVQKVDAVIFTHEHKDHTAGLDDVRAFNFKHKMDMPIYAEARVMNQLKQEFSYAFGDSKYPGVPRLSPVVIDEKPFEIQGVKIIPIRGFHHKLPVLGYRIGNLAYITDVNLLEKSSLDKLKGLDVFVINALRKEKHISHYTLGEALEVIQVLSPKKAFLTHLSHLMGLQAVVEKSLSAGVEFGTDGKLIVV
jgi:phosphoribosyl 1,2-cyclic phosphate phosphodiesterase